MRDGVGRRQFQLRLERLHPADFIDTGNNIEDRNAAMVRVGPDHNTTLRGYLHAGSRRKHPRHPHLGKMATSTQDVRPRVSCERVICFRPTEILFPFVLTIVMSGTNRVR